MCRGRAPGSRSSFRGPCVRSRWRSSVSTRILIIDDEPNILGTVAPLLRSRGYEVFSAMSGRAGLQGVDRDKPDLIVLDLGLPDMDGVEVCRRIRETTNVPVLVL